ncbi:unnamed protein product [Schistocephalus solidus]|uniref:guanylate cyclase n=1 Tax=Schistocephalus solidus TaxID=70667 RepID=A0A183THK0_SCHSO|nr:unnamed protein product [Schistocephalus solidus]
MYGLLLKALRAYVEDVFEDDLWSRVAISANCEGYDFNEIKSYAEELFQDCARAISEETSVPFDEVMFNIGSFFLCFLLRSRYSKMLKVLGRNLGEFFSELNNLHRHMHFKFPEMVAPFFTCASEYASGLTLQYGSTRKGYVHYTRGIITGIAKMFDQPVDVEVVHQTEMSAIFRLHYKGKVASALDDRFRLPATVFFEIFPFSILLDRILNIKTAGMGVLRVDPTIIKKQFSDCFAISSPFIELTWENVCHVLFCTLIAYFVTQQHCVRCVPQGPNRTEVYRLRDVSDMIAVGLSLEDLSLHDSSRHRVLIGEQQSAELKLALREEQAKTKELEAITQRAEEENKRAENLLYRMLPQKIAMGLRKGIRPVGMSEHFENVTILFTDIVAFTVICSKLEPIEVVSMLSDLFAKFDELTTKYGVYKVETIGDAYMIASGCPEPTKLHAAFVAEVSFALKETTEQTPNPTASPPENLKIRIGELCKGCWMFLTSIDVGGFSEHCVPRWT